MNTTKILGEAVSIQRQDILDRTEEQTAEGLTGAVILGRFKRGRVDAPMAIHQGNIRGQLGHDPKNLDYIAVQDCLDMGVPSVQVLRIANDDNQCTIAPVEVKVKNFIEDAGGKEYAIFYSIDGMPRLHQLDAANVTFQEGSYLNVAEMLNNFYGVDRNLFKMRCEAPDYQVSCKVRKQTYPIYLRKAAGYWNTLPAAQISVVYKGVTHTLDTPAGNFSYTGDLYNYIITLFDSLKTFLQGIGLDGFLIPDETFKNGTGSSFNASYFPQFRIEAPDGDLSQFSITWAGTNGWLLDGYRQSNECMTHYSLDEVFNADTLLKFSTYHPANNEESEEEGSIELEPHKSRIIFDASTAENGGLHNILQAIGVHQDIKLNGCYIGHTEYQ
ncbi:MAG: hypothetical protein WB445_04215 [Acinetobacter sp.]